jgi:hypothetical protein
MSTKGISARAARDLVDRLHGPAFTLHDFDKNGFVMKSGFRAATDLGIRLEDVERLGLSGEPQPHRNPAATERNLLANRATREEAVFIAGGTRVELNELTGRDFIDFVEAKLEEHGVEKVIPNQQTLAAAWRRGRVVSEINKRIEKANAQQYDSPPHDLGERVRQRVEEEPDIAWSDAVILEMDADGVRPTT